MLHLTTKTRIQQWNVVRTARLGALRRLGLVAAASLGLIAASARATERAPAAEDLLSKRFPAKNLQEDFSQLRTVLESHPALHAFISRQDLDRLFDAGLAAIDRDMTSREFASVVLPIVARLGCGHTQLRYPADHQKSQQRFFPLALAFTAGKAWVTDSAPAGEQVPRGSVVTAINGVSMAEIERVLRETMSMDRCSEGARTAWLTSHFPLYYAPRYGCPAEFAVTFVAPGETGVRHVTLPAADRESLPCVKAGKALFARKTSSGDPFLELEMLPQYGAALITIRSFVYYEPDRARRFREFVDRSFKAISEAKATNLIIDLRQNSGGDPNAAAYLLSYLQRMPTTYFAAVYPGYGPLAEPAAPVAGSFQGKVHVLIDAVGFSTTGHFCALLKHHKLAVFVGQETGGSYTCNAATQDVELRHTRFRLRYATGSFAAAVRDVDRTRGTIPDIAISPTIEDILAKKDVERDAVLSLLAAPHSSARVD